VAVGVLHERGARAGLRLVARLLHDAVVVDRLERRVDVVDADGDVVVVVAVVVVARLPPSVSDSWNSTPVVVGDVARCACRRRRS